MLTVLVIDAPCCRRTCPVVEEPGREVPVDIFACDEPPSVSVQPVTVLDGLEPNESENKVTGAATAIDAGNSDNTTVAVVIAAVIFLTLRTLPAPLDMA